MDFHSIHVFSLKKVDNNANFAAGVIINRRTHHSSLYRDKNKHYVASYVMSHMMLPRMFELFPYPTFVA
jgi:hypothetical protein